jgi:hypothetical protein
LSKNAGSGSALNLSGSTTLEFKQFNELMNRNLTKNVPISI